MNKTAIALIVATLIIGFASASILVTYYYPSTGVVVTAEFTQILDGTLWSNGTTLDWGNVVADTTYQYDNLTVWNTGSRNCTVTLVTPDLPNGWQLTWTGNGTRLEPTEHISAPFQLYIASNASAGPFSLSHYIHAEEA